MSMPLCESLLFRSANGLRGLKSKKVLKLSEDLNKKAEAANSVRSSK